MISANGFSAFRPDIMRFDKYCLKKAWKGRSRFWPVSESIRPVKGCDRKIPKYILELQSERYPPLFSEIGYSVGTDGSRPIQRRGVSALHKGVFVRGLCSRGGTAYYALCPAVAGQRFFCFQRDFIEFSASTSGKIYI